MDSGMRFTSSEPKANERYNDDNNDNKYDILRHDRIRFRACPDSVRVYFDHFYKDIILFNITSIFLF
jgi:hypothetical protein